MSIRHGLVVLLGVTAGYRRQSIELDDIDDVSADVGVGGPFVGLQVGF